MKTPTSADIHQQIEAASVSATLVISPLPEAICYWFRRLADEGHDSRLVGECVLQLVLGVSPTHYRAESSISRESLLSLAPRAIPTGVRSGVITVPTSAGPLDLLPECSGNETLRRPNTGRFDVLNLAFDPLQRDTLTASQAIRDIASRSLDIPSNATACGDPAFALEAARLIAIYHLEPSARLLDHARKTRLEVSALDHPRLRVLIREILLAPGAGAGLAFLRDSGAEAALVSGVRANAPALVDQLPVDLRVRLCAWLLDTDAKHLLRALRFGGQFSSDLYRLFDHHPLDECAPPSHDREVRKLLRRLSQVDIAELLTLRRAEAGMMREAGQSAEADRVLDSLKRLQKAFSRVRDKQRQSQRRARLAISGSEIMQRLGCEPGRVVGRAIQFLERVVEADPDINTQEALLAELERWRAAQ